MSEKPNISVVVTAYNHQDYIEECLISILEQKFSKEFEVIVSVDPCGDETLAKCYSLRSKYTHLKVLENPSNNVFYSVHGNRIGRGNFINALKNANAPWIAFCDGDDYWIDPDKLERQYQETMADSSISLVFSNRYILRGKELVANNIKYASSSFSTDDVIRGMVAYSQTMLFRNHAKLLEFLSQFNDIQGGDYLITYFQSLHGKVLYLPDHVAAVYRTQINSTYATLPLTKRLAQTITQMMVIRDRLGLKSTAHIRNKIVKDILVLIPHGLSAVLEYLDIAKIQRTRVFFLLPIIVWKAFFDSGRRLFASIKRKRNV